MAAARSVLPTWRERGTDLQGNAAPRKQRQEIARPRSVGSCVSERLLVAHDAATIKNVVDAKSELGLIPTGTVSEHVVEVHVCHAEGVDGNHLVGNGPAG